MKCIKENIIFKSEIEVIIINLKLIDYLLFFNLKFKIN